MAKADRQLASPSSPTRRAGLAPRHNGQPCAPGSQQLAASGLRSERAQQRLASAPLGTYTVQAELLDAQRQVLAPHVFAKIVPGMEENEVRRIAIMNYAKQPTPGLAGFVSTLYERGLTPFPAEQAKGMGFVRDADKAAQWQKQKEGKK